MIPCYGIHLTAFCSRSDFQTSLVEIPYFPPMSMWWQLQLIISENLRNFGDGSWNSNWQKVKDEVFWSDAPSTWLHLTIRRRSVDAVFRPVRIVTRRSKGRSGGPRCTPPPPGQLSRTQPCLLLPWNKYLETSQNHFLWTLNPPSENNLTLLKIPPSSTRSGCLFVLQLPAPAVKAKKCTKKSRTLGVEWHKHTHPAQA